MVPKMVVPKYTFTTLEKDLDKLLARACFFNPFL